MKAFLRVLSVFVVVPSLALLSSLLLASCRPLSVETTPTAAPTIAATTEHSPDGVGRAKMPMVPSALPGEDDIAIYPGASDVELDEENAPLHRSVFYITPDPMDKVYEFYRNTYEAKGWRINDRRITFMDADFIWADEEGVIPWNVGLGLDVYNDAPGGTRYVVWVSRQPDPDNIPVIEGATDVQVTMSNEGLEGVSLDLGPMRVITYSTTVTATDILHSYQYHMESYGWRNRSEQPGEVSFSYSYGVPEQMYFNTAIVKTEPEGKSGRSLVTVRVAGADVHKLEGAYTPPIAPLASLLAEPAPIPTYPGAESTTVDDPKRWQSRLFGLKTMEAWTTKDSPKQVEEFYINALTERGWKKVEHPRANWHRFTYDTGPTCQSRHAVYLVVTPQSDGGTHILVITYLGCYVISGDE